MSHLPLIKYEDGVNSYWPWGIIQESKSFFAKLSWQLSSFNLSSLDNNFPRTSNDLKASEAAAIILRSDISGTWTRHSYLSQMMPDVFKFDIETWELSWHKAKSNDELTSLPTALIGEVATVISKHFTTADHESQRIGLAWLAILVKAHYDEACAYLLAKRSADGNLLKRVILFYRSTATSGHQGPIPDMSQRLAELKTAIYSIRDEARIHEEIKPMILNITHDLGMDIGHDWQRNPARAQIQRSSLDSILVSLDDVSQPTGEAILHEIILTLYAHDLYPKEIFKISNLLETAAKNELVAAMSLIDNQRHASDSDGSLYDEGEDTYHDY